MSTEAKLAAFESLLSEVSGALADMVSAMQEKRENSSLEEISTTLIDIHAAIEAKAKGKPLEEVIAAIKAIRITAPAVTVTNEVSPTPVQIIVQPAEIHIMPAPEAKASTWEIRIPGQYGGSDRVMTITKTS